jgi:threonine/homoserine/homoserine lactone efflux protein
MSSFLTLLIQILPLAFGAAVSPTALMGIIILLSVSKKPKLQSFGYYIGSLILIIIVTIIGILLGTGITTGYNKPHLLLDWIDVILGILLLFLGTRRIIQTQKSPKNRIQSSNEPKSNLNLFLKGISYGFGLFLINFSTTIIVIEAGKEIAVSPVGLVGKLLIIMVLIVITLLVCEVPLLMYVLSPEKAKKILLKVNKWMQRNGHILMGIVIFLIGAYLILVGLIRLRFI